MSGTGNSLSTSDKDGCMEGLHDVDEDEELNLSDVEQAEADSDDGDEDMQQVEGSQTQSTQGENGPKIVSGSSQGEGSRK